MNTNKKNKQIKQFDQGKIILTEYITCVIILLLFIQ